MNIGILGGGQLARMLAQAGRAQGVNFMFLSPEEPSCAAPFGEHLLADYDDLTALKKLAQWADVVTYEFENIPAQSIQFLEAHAQVHPSSNALAISRHRVTEKQQFATLGIATAKFAAIESLASLEVAVEDIGYPAILKTCTEGYDGKGQRVLRAPQELASAWHDLGGVPCILEAMVPFQRELSIIATRSKTGDKVFYPVSENYHREGILRLSLSRPNDPMQPLAEALINRLLDALSFVGTLTLELFQVGDQLLANEMAPRVHNSGHWTIEGARTSQFENHLRAIQGLALGEPQVTKSAAMVNIVGERPVTLVHSQASFAYLHDYTKAERPGRKIGHLTLLDETGAADGLGFTQRVATVLALMGEDTLEQALLTGQIQIYSAS
jgi:5-(carboxyamino)imidazole ribonucleotide synthase